jgi:hypothetical protein
VNLRRARKIVFIFMPKHSHLDWNAANFSPDTDNATWLPHLDRFRHFLRGPQIFKLFKNQNYKFDDSEEIFFNFVN